jgi:hypothetical protein
MSQKLSAGFTRRWNISALTENHIDALELWTVPCVPRPGPRRDHGRMDMSAGDIRPVNVTDATHVTLQVLNPHRDLHQVGKVRQALAENIRALWPAGAKGQPFEPAA